MNAAKCEEFVVVEALDAETYAREIVVPKKGEEF